jgi:glutamate N-acetyltransferase / amino-acid N-acetyltransferase
MAKPPSKKNPTKAAPPKGKLTKPPVKLATPMPIGKSKPAPTVSRLKPATAVAQNPQSKPTAQPIIAPSPESRHLKPALAPAKSTGLAAKPPAIQKPNQNTKSTPPKPTPAKAPPPPQPPLKIAAPVPLPPKKHLAPSPLAPKSLPNMPPLSGVRLASGQAAIKYLDRTDLTLVVMAPGATVAGAFTTSKTASAPVEWCRANLSGGSGRVLVVNSGNANAFTGQQGRDAVRATAESAAALAGCRPSEVFIASTGVIGEPLPVNRLTKALPQVFENASAAGWKDAAQAIMTTDTFPKAASATARIDNAQVRINGIAKGSGMIQPDLATMLAFIFTDAKLPADVLQQLLNGGLRTSFNAITVDSDTSTSDTVLLFASGKGAAHAPVTKVTDRRLDDFREKLQAVMTELAVQVVRDGEGATKLIQITVNGAETPKAARTIAMAIGNSPLVKTAIAGGDANWGRVVMAVGKAGEAADRDRLSIRFGGKPVATMGQRDATYNEREMASYMKSQKIDIEVDVGIGNGSAKIWTCDLTHGYISINGDYRS